MLAAGAPASLVGGSAALEERWSRDIGGGVRPVRGGDVSAAAAYGVPPLRRLAYGGGPCAPGRPIKVGVRPAAIAITPDGKTAYVTNLLSSTVTPIATATNTPGKPIKVPRLPEAIAITPDGKTAYVAVWSGVIPITTATNTRGRLIKAGPRSLRGIAAIVVTP
jgi:YVTN family beta-propeller protein